MGEVARIIMDRWAQDSKATLSRTKVEVYMLAKYVDDVNVAIGIIQKGWRWKESEQGRKKLEYSQEAMEEDTEDGRTDIKRTMNLMVEEASKILLGIKFTADLPELNDSGRCPVLDLEVWASPLDPECFLFGMV